LHALGYNVAPRLWYPEVHSKKVDWISHWHEEGYLSFNVRFTDGKNSSILCSPTIVTNVVDFSDIKTGDSVIIREYYRAHNMTAIVQFGVKV
jgi:hypothetical protein